MKVALGLFTISIALLSLAGSADAASLRPAGKYAFTAIESCEAKFGFTTESVRLANGKTDTAVRIINSQHNGHIGSGSGYISFTPKSATGGTFTFSMIDVGGGALRVNNGGTDVTVKAESASGNYSFTGTTMVLTPSSGPTMSFRMVFGALSSSGAPNSVHLVRKSSSGETGNCTQSIIATK